MKAPYKDELAALDETYRLAASGPVDALIDLFDALRGGPAVFIGSGGAMAVAHVAARLHQERNGQAAQVCTSLEALSLPYEVGRGAVLFSSSAKHPDSELVLETFRRRLFHPAGVVTYRSRDDLEDKAGPDTSIVQLPPPPVRDGFLATGSVMQMVVSLLVSWNPSCVPQHLASPGPAESRLRDEMLVLFPPTLSAVAADIEVRLVESGLAAVQLSDYRNFAHGRHTGLARRIDRVTVLALSDVDSQALATGTIGCLPGEADVRHWHAEDSWPGAVPQLLARSMALAGSEGLAAGLDVARPSVPPFGRALYRLPLKRRVPLRVSDGVERKIRALGMGVDPETRANVGRSLADWLAALVDERFTAIVCDYDGTVCWTSKRYDLPEEPVRDGLLAVLDSGASLGFASGRGRSLHGDLRKWVPVDHWPSVLLGLYNGGVVTTLAEDLDDLREGSDWSARVVDVLRGLDQTGGSMEERGCQVSVAAPAGGRRRAEEIQDALVAASVPARAAASGHSVDIVPLESSKVSVLERLERDSGGAVLAIGDQGDRGGNDFDLMASRRWSLTVDACSSSLDRCWFVGDGSAVGPDLFNRYLASLRPMSGGLAVRGLKP